MPKPNKVLREMNARNEAKYQMKFDRRMHSLMQLCCDAAVLSAHDELGMGAGRAERFVQTMQMYILEISKLINSDAADPDLEYTKAKVDGKLKQICGDKFSPWDERYGGN